MQPMLLPSSVTFSLFLHEICPCEFQRLLFEVCFRKAWALKSGSASPFLWMVLTLTSVAKQKSTNNVNINITGNQNVYYTLTSS
jgi:hypothetical protein